MKLEARALSFRYDNGNRQILNNLSMTLTSTDRLGLIAPSGFGKTTFCKILAGYEKPDSGEVLLDGKPLSDWKGYCPVQMIWQHPELSVNPRWKMGEVLKEGDQVEQRIMDGLELSRTGLTGTLRSCPAVSSSVSALPGRWDRERGSFWRMRSARCWI